MDHSRRKFVRTTVVFSAAGQTALAGCGQGEQVNRQLKFNSLGEALKEAERLATVNPTMPADGFSLPQTLIHCAQSIEFSFVGFPQEKSAVFQSTIGSLLFSVFSWRGRMSHNLAEAIPGAEPLDSDISIEQALLRLQQSASQFASTNSALKPHFAYGKLTRREYDMAHAMHLANHFSVIEA